MCVRLMLMMTMMMSRSIVVRALRSTLATGVGANDLAQLAPSGCRYIVRDDDTD